VHSAHSDIVVAGGYNINCMDSINANSSRSRTASPCGSSCGSRGFRKGGLRLLACGGCQVFR